MDTNFQMVKELNKNFTPKTRGFLDGEEVDFIKSELHLAEMNVLQLRNLRDFVVMYYDILEAHDMDENPEKRMMYMDKMSGITAVIDSELIEKGAEM